MKKKKFIINLLIKSIILLQIIIKKINKQLNKNKIKRIKYTYIKE